LIDRERIQQTYARIEPYVRKTPILELNGADLGLAPSSLLTL